MSRTHVKKHRSNGNGSVPSVPDETPQVRASEEAIREAAYLKWEAAGRPPGDGVEFWLQAELELQPLGV